MTSEPELDRLRAVFEALPSAALLFAGSPRRIVAATPAGRRLLGGADPVGMPAADAVPALVDALDRVQGGQGQVTAPLTREGAAPVDFSCRALRGGDGTIWGVMAIAEPEAPRAPAEVERLLQQVLDALPVGVLVADARGGLIWQNPASARMWGGRLDAFADYRAWWSESGRPIEAHEWGLARALRGEESAGEVLDIEGGGGLRRTILNSAATLRDRAGGIIGAVAVYEDITEPREREKRRAMLAAALEGLSEGVCVTTGDGELLYANQAFAAMLPGEGDGASSRLQDVAPQAAGELEEALGAAVRDGRWSGRMRGLAGREAALDVLLGRVDHPFGGGLLLFGIIRDVSGQLLVERQLRQAERLASLGTLVGGVAHELNNPLSAVLGFTELMLMDDRPPGDRDDLLTIRREAERMARIVADLRVLARGASEVQAEDLIDLSELVRHVVATRGAPLQAAAIEVRLELADLPSVLGDRGRLEQAVLNLIVNAEEALASAPEERRLIVRTRPSGHGATLQVVDNGPGIPPRHLERIFDPFFTTKGPGEGTGLGLALVHTIVTEHHGEVRVDSEVGAGTAFRVDLPRAPGDAPRRGAPEATPRLHALVMHGEGSARRMVIRYLARLGCDADEAADGKQALGMIDLAEVPYDVILADLSLPGLGGADLAARLEERGLADRLIVLSAGEPGVAPAGTASHLAGPISLEVLSRALAAVTGRPSSP